VNAYDIRALCPRTRRAAELFRQATVERALGNETLARELLREAIDELQPIGGE
jgi:hypothetical protein